MTASERDAYYQGAQAMKLAAMENLQAWVDSLTRSDPRSLSACNFAAARVVVEMTLRPDATE